MALLIAFLMLLGGIIAGLRFFSAQVPARASGPAWTVVAQDTFIRPKRLFWGKSSDGQNWGGEANSATAFALTPGQGMITGVGPFDAVLGRATNDADVTAQASIAKFDGGHSNLGVVVRWTDRDNWYKAYIDGQHLILLKDVHGTITRLGSIPLVAVSGQKYFLRMNVAGNLISAKAWSVKNAEPLPWSLQAHDSSHARGKSGIRVFLTTLGGNQAMFFFVLIRS
jgi:hypothetical protein